MNKEMVAKIISIVLYPEIVIGLLLLLIFFKENYDFTMFIIGLFLLCAVQSIAKSPLIIKNKEREERKKAYVITAISYCAYFFISYTLNPNSLFSLVGLSLFIGCIAMALCNLMTKVSVHCGTVGLISTCASIITFPWGIICLMACPLIVWSRVTNKNHELNEAIIGTSLGIASSLIGYITWIL